MKTTHGYNKDKSLVLKRLNRAEGQVRGVATMVENDKYCIDVLTQISAAQAALDKVAMMLLEDHTNHCMMQAKTDKDRQKKASELMTAVSRILSR